MELKTLILIDLNSIKQKNEVIHGTQEVTGSIYGHLPECLNDDSIQVVSWRGETRNCHSVSEIDFIVPDPDDFIRLFTLARHMRKPKLTVRLENHWIEHRGMDYGPQYYYKHIPIPLECSDCGKFTMSDELEQTTVINEDGDEFEMDKCPYCDELKTFNYSYETIYQALKRKNDQRTA